MKINGLNNCSEEDVLSALDRVEKEEKEFAILEQDESDFIQTWDGELEYRHDETQFRVADAPVDKEKIKAAFLSYYHEDGEYQNMFHWEPLEEDFSIQHESLWSIFKKIFRKR